VLDIASAGGALLVPLIGSLVSLGLLAAAYGGAALLGLRGPRRGAFLNCGMMSNIGMSLGGFICYMFLGVQGQGLSVLYTAHFLPVCFTLGVVLASHYARRGEATVGQTLRGVVRNPLVLIPNGALVVGLALNAARAGVPDWIGPANALVVFAVVSLHAFAIGLTLRLSRVGAYWREAVALAATKFLLGPAIAAAVVFLLGQWGAHDGLLWRTAVILGAMPVAIFATVVSNLFDLDRDLANSAWVLTTLACAAAIPILYLITA
jgi:predicted permease